MRAIGWRLASVLFLGLVIALWYVEARLELVSPLFLPGPDRTFRALVNGFTSGVLGSRLLGTVERMIYGWLIASLAGVLIGSLIGISRNARAYLQPMLEYLRPLPASAIIPVAIPIFGLTDKMVLIVTGFAALWPTLLATIHGFAAVEPRLEEVARILRLNRLQFILKIAIPNALPDIIAGMRLSLTYALILSVVGEMLAGRDGLGNWILTSSRFFRAPDVFAGVLLLGAVGYLSAVLISAAERRLLRWRNAGH
jgi:sulfonate transport system permease protein